MIKLNCLVKERCSNRESLKCLKCFYNRDVQLEDNFEEKEDKIPDIDKLRIDLKNEFDADLEQNFMDTIDDVLLNKIIREKYRIEPLSTEGMIIKEIFKGIMAGDDKIINRFINPEDREEVARIIEMHNSHNPFAKVQEMVELRKQAKEFKNQYKSDFDEKIKKRMNTEYGFATVNKDKATSGVQNEASKINEYSTKDSLSEYFKELENNIFRK